MNQEYYTYDAIMARMLSQIPDSLDKREGSIIFDALGPAGYELAQYYLDLLAAYEDTFIATAQGEALDARCEELGLSRSLGACALRQGVFRDENGDLFDVAIDSRFSTLEPGAGVNYRVATRVSQGIFRLEAEVLGTQGNEYSGDLLAINHIPGLGSAVLTDILIPGEDRESDEELRARAKNYLTREEGDGNARAYQKWAEDFEGVGRAKVFPLWNGANTVKVSILNSLMGPASPTLVAALQEYLDPNSAGLGNGVAPIGALVTVTTAQGVTMGAAATVLLTEGYTLAQAQTQAEAALTALFAEVSYQKSRVSYIEVGAAILSCPAVETVQALTLEGGQADIALASEEIPVLGPLTLTQGVS